MSLTFIFIKENLAKKNFHSLEIQCKRLDKGNSFVNFMETSQNCTKTKRQRRGTRLHRGLKCTRGLNYFKIFFHKDKFAQGEKIVQRQFCMEGRFSTNDSFENFAIRIILHESKKKKTKKKY